MKITEYYRKRTKIICTIGPASSSAAVIKRLIKSGMDVARFNLSHGTISEHICNIKTVRRLSNLIGIKVAILIDIPGPKYRIGKLEGSQTILRKGAQVVLTTRKTEGAASLLPVTLPSLCHDIKVGDKTLLDDGTMELKVLEVNGTEVKCRVTVGGRLLQGKGLMVPGMVTSSPFITDSLREDIGFAIKQKADYLAISFVTSSEDVTEVKNILQENNADIPVITKIERKQAVNNFNSILSVSDGIMVARGDLGIEIPVEKLPLVQKEIIRKCNRVSKIVITATEMLESMINSMRPTRAETTDVANAIYDGTDAIMLSAETSIGKYPVRAVKIMAKIARATEKALPYKQMLDERSDWLEGQTGELISYNACYTAHYLKAVAIIAFTQSGSTACMVAKYRPRIPILALTSDRSVSNRLLIRWGVYPWYVDEVTSLDELFATGVKRCKDLGLAKKGDLIVITGGIPIGQAGSTNLLKVETVG
ncbi:MAG: pyruvate kinase [Dehalococcoidales bacterium]